ALRAGAGGGGPLVGIVLGPGVHKSCVGSCLGACRLAASCLEGGSGLASGRGTLTGELISLRIENAPREKINPYSNSMAPVATWMGAPPVPARAGLCACH